MRKNFTYHANSWGDIEENVSGIDVFPDNFQSLDHFTFVNVPRVRNMPCHPVPD
jgi:hypothetical protein